MKVIILKWLAALAFAATGATLALDAAQTWKQPDRTTTRHAVAAVDSLTGVFRLRTAVLGEQIAHDRDEIKRLTRSTHALIKRCNKPKPLTDIHFRFTRDSIIFWDNRGDTTRLKH